MQNSKLRQIRPIFFFTGILLALVFCFLPPAFASKNKPGLINGLSRPYSAPLILGITSWINSGPITLSDLKDKVVLIEFWTSSCPYCKKALPYVNDWYQRYHNKGLLIIGIHSPKNEEEQNAAIVKDAVAAYNIQYPVALDNNFETWQSFDAQGWPSFFLINKKGKVVYVSYGAENYQIIENNIEYLLKQ